MTHDGLTIAVVDDDDSVRLALQQLLRAGGFDARSFSSAEAFLAARETMNADCLVLDVNLPGMSGVALARLLTAQGRRIPIVLISAREDSATRGLIRSAGTLPFLRKPFGGEELFAAMSRAVREHDTD